MPTPKISVIIPVYKVEDYLNQCVESVLSQSFTDLEIILVDDGSPDGCPVMCDTYESSDARIRVVHQKNLGLAGARNTGLRLARGDYVAFLDSDDYLMPDAYAKLYDKAVEHDADIVFCQAQYFDDTRQQSVITDDSSALPLFKHKKFSGAFNWRDVGAEKIFSYDSFVVAWNKLCKRSFLVETGADFPLGLIYEDNPFYFQTIFAAKRMTTVMERLVCYRINRKGSIISDVAENKGAKAIHILGIMAHIEMRLATLLPEHLRCFFHTYALNEIRHKFALIPERLWHKYLSLAKGLLPPFLYCKLRAYVFGKNLKSAPPSIEAFIRIIRNSQASFVQIFRNITLFSFEKSKHQPGQYSSILALGAAYEIARTLESIYPVNNFSLHCHMDSQILSEHLEELIAKTPSESFIHNIINSPRSPKGECICTFGVPEEAPAMVAVEAASIRGSLAIASSVLFIDFALKGLDPYHLKTLFYTLNCFYPYKDIHYLRLEGKRKSPLVPTVKNLTYKTLPPAGTVDMLGALKLKLKGLEAEQFNKYLRVAVLGLPLFTGRKR